jgi:2-polyprenyl-6-methoxyphenol hydroxylase-like FAD-dependent oxidoreductase
VSRIRARESRAVGGWCLAPRYFDHLALRNILRAYARYYNDIRTHRSLDKDAPVCRPVQRTGSINAHPILGGFITTMYGFRFRYTHDVVVGCDGIRSAVRSCVFGGEGPRYGGTMCWRALAPRDALPKYYHDRHVNQCSGGGAFVISYYIRQGKFINFVAVRQQPGWTEQSWSVPSNVEEMLMAFPTRKRNCAG